MPKILERVMAWLARSKAQPESIQLPSVPFYEKMMAVKRKLRVVNNDDLLLLSLRCSRICYYSTTVKPGSWLYELLERNFPTKIRKPLDNENKGRWQTLTWKELRKLH